MNITGVINNSVNVHMLRNKLLFIIEISPYSLRVYVGTRVRSNKIKGTRLAYIQECDNDNKAHKIHLH